MHISLTLLSYCLTCLLFRVARANVEKTIFLGPPRAKIPSGESDLDDLGLERLSPHSPVVRTRLNATFPTDDAPLGTESWFFLEGLKPGQRYEVRVCWLATQPTSFTLSTYTIRNIFQEPPLLAAVTRFSSSRALLSSPLDSFEKNTNRKTTNPRNHASSYSSSSSSSADPAQTSDSTLFLRIHAAADYFSLDSSLMENVPPVLVDVILDPFLLNVFPASLVPTACWLTVVAGVAVFVARWVTGYSQRAVTEAEADMVRERRIDGKKDE